ncbi:MAG: SigE family RNA polymerase sigma factor [Micromonosporaceae bacterium]|nr:SigE family RNA polymerase sigma factor [Micromonosporaceae bacterium]
MAGSAAERAFAEFVAARYARLVRTGYLLTGDRGHAEDLVQQALLKTFRSWHRLEAEANAEAYTRTTMLRMALGWRRRRWNGEVPTGALPEAASADHSSTVDTAEVVRRALAGLPPGQRAVLVLRYFEDLSEAEIAETLGCSPGTVKSRCSRALAALRAAGLLVEDSHKSR